MAVMITINWKREQDAEGLFVLTASVTSATDIDNSVFLFQRQSDGTDEYYSICTLDNMLNVQETTPASGSTYSRKATMSLTFDLAQDMLDNQEDMETDINKLIDDWELYLNDLIKEYEETYTGTEE